jgi:hypothetical protein
MVMGVDQKRQGAVTELIQRSADLPGELLKLVIDHEQAVGAGGDADVAATTSDHVHATLHVHGPDFVVLSANIIGDDSQNAGQGNQENGQSIHGNLSV